MNIHALKTWDKKTIINIFSIVETQSRKYPSIKNIIEIIIESNGM